MTEQEALRLSKNENTLSKAFEWIVNEYSERLYWHVRRMVHNHEDANDVVQNAFLRIWKSLKGFRGDSKLYTWIYRIATNEALSFLNKKSTRMQNQLMDIEDYKYTLKADDYFDGDEAQQKLSFAISTLPERQKQVFILRYYDEMKYADMAEVLSTSEGALKASYHHAARKIEKIITSG